MSDPIPPRDIDAEQALLGSIMIAPYLFVDLVAIVKAEYFYRNSHRWIWEAMHRLLESEQQIDQVTLCNALNTSGKLKEIGCRSGVHHRASQCNSDFHARRVLRQDRA